MAGNREEIGQQPSNEQLARELVRQQQPRRRRQPEASAQGFGADLNPVRNVAESGFRELPADKAEQLRSDARQQAAEDSAFSASEIDVEVNREGDRFVAEARVLEEAQRRRAAEQISEQVPGRVTSDDVTREVDSPKLLEPGMTPAEVQAQTEVQFKLENEVAREKAAREISEEVAGAVDADELVESPGGGFRLSEEARADVAAEEVQQNTSADLERGADFDVTTRTTAERQAALERQRQQLEQFPFFGDASDAAFLQAPPAVDVDLTAQGEAALLRERARQTGELEINGETVDVEPDQIQVDSGEVAVSGVEGDIDLRDSTTDRFVGGVADFAAPVTDNVGNFAGETVDFLSDVERRVTREGRSGEVFQGIGSGTMTTADTIIDSPVVSVPNQGIRTFGDEVGDLSDEARTSINQDLAEAGQRDTSTPIVAGSRVVEADFLNPVSASAAQGAVDLTVGLPDELFGTAAGLENAAQFTGGEIGDEGFVQGSANAIGAGASVAGATAVQFGEAVEQRPGQTLGRVAGGGVVGTALSPVRFSKLKVPKKGGSTSTVRGVRITEPLILRGRVDTPGKTIAGTVDGRPTLGTPRIDPKKVDFEEFGQGKGATFEPESRFETDVARGMAAEAGPDALERFEAAEQLAARGVRTDSELQTSSTTEIIREAEEIPDEAAPAIAEAVQELDATIFGSASVRAQVPGARQPRDLDIAVDDKDVAKQRLSEAVSSTEAEIDAFDIKAREERATPGEIVKFGRIARERLETDEGVKITPASEELLKKAGASAFLRGRGSPVADELGATERFDIGPEPVAEDSFIRAKDPGDAATIGTELAVSDRLSGRINPLSRRRERTVSEFRRQFEPEIERSLAEPAPLPERPDLSTEKLQIQRLLADESAEVRPVGGRQRPKTPEIEAESAPTAPDRPLDDSPATRPARRSDIDSERSPSRSADFDPASTPAAPSTPDSPATVAPRPDSPGTSMAFDSPGAGGVVDSPTGSPPVDVPSPTTITDVDAPSPATTTQTDAPSPTTTGGGDVPSPSTTGGVNVPSPTATGGGDVPSPVVTVGIDIPSPIGTADVDVPVPPTRRQRNREDSNRESEEEEFQLGERQTTQFNPIAKLGQREISPTTPVDDVTLQEDLPWL